MYKSRRIRLVPSIAVAGAIALSGCGGSGGDSSSVSGYVYDGPIKGAKVCAYDASNTELGCSITNETGAYSLNVSGTIAYLKAIPQDGAIDLGLDKVQNTADDAIFSDILISDYGDTTNITPLTYLRHLGLKTDDISKDVDDLAMLDMQIVVSAVDMLKSLGLTTEESYKAVKESINPSTRALGGSIVISKAAISAAAPEKAATIPDTLIEKVSTSVSNIAAFISQIAVSIQSGTTIGEVRNKLIAVKVVATSVANVASETMTVVNNALSSGKTLADVETEITTIVTNIDTLAGSTTDLETVVNTIATVVATEEESLAEGTKLDMENVAKEIAADPTKATDFQALTNIFKESVVAINPTDYSVKVTVNSLSVGNSILEGSATVGSTSSISYNNNAIFTHSPLNGNSFDDIRNNLGNLFDITVTITNSSSLPNNSKDITIGAFVIDKNNNNRYVLAAIPATLTKDIDSLKVEVKSGADMILIGQNSSGTPFDGQKTNDIANIKTGTAATGEKTWTFSVANVFDQFANHPDIGTTIKDIIYRTATSIGTYDIYVIISNNAFGTTSNDISFTNDLENIDLNALTGISNGTALDSKIDNLFGASSNLHGFKATLEIK